MVWIKLFSDLVIILITFDIRMADNNNLKQFRCMDTKCNKVLFEAELINGTVKKNCKCGKVNIFTSSEKHKSGQSFQDSVAEQKK